MPGSNYSANIQSNGSFNIPDITNPANYKRIRLTSNEGIDRETNISLNVGDNTANITMIESDNVTGYNYADYLTINQSGVKMNSNKNYQVYFYDKSVWEYDGNNWNVVGTASDIYADDAIAKCRDVLQNDLPRLSKGAYSYNDITLESNNPNGPGIPTYSDKKDGWLVIYIADQNTPLTTSTFDTNGYIVSAILQIDYSTNVQQPNFQRRAYCQDICAWAGFVDTLQKSNVSIFADGESGYDYPQNPTPFDVNYAAEIKHRRAVRHGEQNSIPDYEPSSGGNGSGVFVTSFLSPQPTFYDNVNENPGMFANPTGPMRGFSDEKRGWNNEYRSWLKKHNQKISETGRAGEIK